ncbi:DUF1972 domain-containing protein [Azonexus fungiphilus]|nr:DUF1972 domain-containing protein [Azonexus fungiphilus]
MSLKCLNKNKTLRILGIRGVPAAHGGFETFAERLSLFLVSRGWNVIVYCQEDGVGKLSEDCWRGVRRVRIPIKQSGAIGTIFFDFKSVIHALQKKDICLTLGYNTAVFCLALRVFGIKNIINMDGIEWKRAKWGLAAKSWFWINERLGCWIGNHLIADHPKIKDHLATRVRSNKISTIPYGADELSLNNSEVLREFGLCGKKFFTVIARPEPENSLLEIVSGFSDKNRDCLLIVLGKYDDNNPYHRAVRGAAGAEVVFLGAIYDRNVVDALRYYSLAYIHGHQVGGTNPSLVEALGAANAIIAHDNLFNRWVAGNSALYFKDSDSFSCVLSEFLSSPDLREKMSTGSRLRFKEDFTWDSVLSKYEDLLSKF